MERDLRIQHYEEAFDLIKHVFNIHELYEDQIQLIKAFQLLT